MVTAFSLTHTPLTLSEAQAVIDSIFPPIILPTDSSPQPKPHLSHPGQITHLTQLSSLGTFNTIYLLHFPSQPDYTTATPQSYPHLVLKLAPPPNIRLLRYESTPTPLLAIEAYLLNHLSTYHNPALPVPRVLAYDDTLTILDSPYLLTTFLPGIPLNHIRDSLSPTQLQHVDFQVGRLLRVINETPAGGGSGGYGGTWGMVTGKPGGNSREWVSDFLEELLHDAEDIRILLPYSEIRRAIGVWDWYLDIHDHHHRQDIDIDILNNPPMNPKLCILDFSDKNILVDPESCLITGIIDFERAFWGDPVAQEVFCLQGREQGVMKGYNSWECELLQLQSQSEPEPYANGNGNGNANRNRNGNGNPNVIDTDNLKLSRGRRNKTRRIRELLYTILSSTTKILQLYYRQLHLLGSDREEMMYRKKLIEALSELGRLEVEGWE